MSNSANNNSASSNSKTASLYSQKKNNNRSSQSINSSSMHRNYVAFPRRSDSMHMQQKNFGTGSYELFDKERMEEELSKLLREIKVKTKEYQTLKNAHNQTEAENLKTIKLIETLITECKQIENPIERHSTTNDINNNKNQSLIQNLKVKLTSYQNELVNKDEQLSELKTKNQKILRLFEIENKLSEATEKYENISKKYNELVTKINDLDYEIQKANESKDFYLFSNSKLKQENEETKTKIQSLEFENADMEEKEKQLEEKNSQMKTKLNELKNSIKEKDEEIEKLKEDMDEYNKVMSEKEKSDQQVTNQTKQINLLKDQSEKKSRQIKELEKQKGDYEKELQMYQNLEKQPKQNTRLINVTNEKKKKEEELKALQGENERLKKEIQNKKNALKPKPFDIDSQITFNLNIPVKIAA